MHLFQKRLELANSHLRECIAKLLQIGPDKIDSLELFTKQFFKLAGSGLLRKKNYRDILVNKILPLIDQMADWRSKNDKMPTINIIVDVENIEDYISIAFFTAYAARRNNDKPDVPDSATEVLSDVWVQKLRKQAERRIDATLGSSLNTEPVWLDGLPKASLRSPQKSLSNNEERLLHIVLILIHIRMLNKTIGNIKTRCF